MSVTLGVGPCVMDDTAPIYVEGDLRQIRVTALGLGKAESSVADSLENLTEYEGRRLTTHLSVPGSVGRGDNWLFYRDVIQAPQWITEIVRDGYIFPLEAEVPRTVKLENNQSALADPAFVWAELLRLERLGCLGREDVRPHVILPLSSVWSKKRRLVVDASRGLNPYIFKRPVVLEQLDSFAEVLKNGDFVAVDDLDSGYWQLPLHPSMFQLCGVSFVNPETGVRAYWTWRVLFLGIRDAVYVFTKANN